MPVCSDACAPDMGSDAGRPKPWSASAPWAPSCWMAPVPSCSVACAAPTGSSSCSTPRWAPATSAAAAARSGRLASTASASGAANSSTPALAKAPGKRRSGGHTASASPSCPSLRSAASRPSERRRAAAATPPPAPACEGRWSTSLSSSSRSAASAWGRLRRAQPSQSWRRGPRSSCPSAAASTWRRSSRQFATKAVSSSSTEKGDWRSSCPRSVVASLPASCLATTRKLEGLRRLAKVVSPGESTNVKTHVSTLMDRNTRCTASSREATSASIIPTRSAFASSTAATMCVEKAKPSRNLHSSSSVSMTRAASSASFSGSLSMFQRARRAATTCCSPAASACLE
mmetsp:Transcript_80114/g.247060  ORF Transcript_80114/g.247060 Transcript_80114/m.247060 type:complete len:344 (+) Transcript_80114:108-1139(+)